MPKFFEYALATWRVSRLLTQEEGPYRIFLRLREYTGVKHNDAGEVISWKDDTGWPFHCLCCTSVYVAFLMAIAPNWVVRWMALSMVAVAGDVIEQWLKKEPGATK